MIINYIIITLKFAYRDWKQLLFYVSVEFLF